MPLHLPAHPSATRWARRLLHFWLVWMLLLFVHESGHSWAARAQGLDVSRVSIGVGPRLWQGRVMGDELVIRLVPLAGQTALAAGTQGADASFSSHGLVNAGILLGSGIAATIGFAAIVAVIVAIRERRRGRRSTWGRAMIADAAVLSAFNFLPIPPLDGGRALLEGLTSLRDSPLSGDTLFWIHAGGLALAVVPMALWTRWTAPIDRIAMRWRAPRLPGVSIVPVRRAPTRETRVA